MAQPSWKLAAFVAGGIAVIALIGWVGAASSGEGAGMSEPDRVVGVAWECRRAGEYRDCQAPSTPDRYRLTVRTTSGTIYEVFSTAPATIGEPWP